MRAFVALDLPEDLLDALEELQGELPGRHVPRENLHLTLAFLGDVRADLLPRVDAALAGLRLAAPELRVGGLDVFGGRRPKLAFASIAPNPALEAARREVRLACRAAGVDLRRERFRPHVTLSRFGRVLGRREEVQLAACLGLVRLPPGRAARLALYRSQLFEAGAVYDRLGAYALT